MEPVETLVAAVTSDDVAAATECLKRHPELRSRLDDPLPGLPFDSTVLLAAVWRRNIPMIELLLAPWGKHQPAQSLLAGGFGVVFRLLMERSPHELAVAAASEVGDEARARVLLNTRTIDPLQLNPRLVKRAVDAAERNDGGAVRRLLLAGWPVNAIGKHGATALHFGAWHGNSELVRETLAHRPSLETRDRDFNMTPLGWAFHGSLHGSNRDRGNYAAVVEALLSAGAVVPGGADAVNASETVRQVLGRWRSNRTA